MGKPSVDTFVSHLSHQPPQCMSWKLDPCYPQIFTYKFLPFSQIRTVLREFQEDRVTDSHYLGSHSLGNTLIINPHPIGGLKANGMTNFKQ